MKTICRALLCLFLSGHMEVFARPALHYEGHMEVNHGFIILTCQLDGVPAKFILDTGAPALILNQKLSGTPSKIAVAGVSALSSAVQAVQMPNINWEGLERADLPTRAMDLSFLENILRMPIAGLLGLDFFDGYFVRINYPESELQLFTKWHSDSRPYQEAKCKQVGHLPVLSFGNRSSALNLALDTGSNINIIAAAASPFVEMHALGSMCTIDINGRTSCNNKVLLQHRMLPGKTAIFVVYDLVFFNQQLSDPIDGLLGQPFLRNYCILIDKKRQYVQFYDWDDNRESEIHTSDGIVATD